MKKLLYIVLSSLLIISTFSTSASARRSGAECLAVGGGYIAVTSDFKTGTSIWDSKTGAYIRTLWKGEPFFANNLLIEGTTLYAGLSDGRVVLVGLPGGNIVREDKNHQWKIFDMAIIGDALYSTPEITNNDGLAMSEKSTGKLLHRIKVTRGCLVSGDEKRFVVSLDDNKYRIYSKTKMSQPKTIKLMKDYLYTRIVLKGSRLYGMTGGSRLHLLDLESGKILKKADPPLFDFAVGSGYIACAVRTPSSRASRISILDENLEPKRTIDLEAESDIDQVAISAEGALLAMDGNSLWVWDLNGGQLLFKIKDTRSPGGK